MPRPKTAAVKTSLGKCTYRYSRENPINAASQTAAAPNFTFMAVKMVALITDANVWPDGND